MCTSLQILISPAKHTSAWTQNMGKDLLKLEANVHALTLLMDLEMFAEEFPSQSLVWNCILNFSVDTPVEFH